MSKPQKAYIAKSSRTAALDLLENMGYNSEKTADTLIQIEKPDSQLNLFDSKAVQAMEKQLKQTRHKMFGAKTPATKKKYRELDKQLREQIASELTEHGWSDVSARQLANWDTYDQNATCPFFDPEWMFDLKGFDVVIGNPPYIQIQKFQKEQKQKWIAQNFQTYAATADIYCLFYERGAQLLTEGGHLCYITSNKWMRADYGKALRLYLAHDLNTTRVLDFGMAQNFGAATTYTCIVSIERATSRNMTQCCYASDDRAAMQDPAGYFVQNAIPMADLSEDSWVVVTPERFKIKQAVEAQGTPLEKWDLRINRGVLTGLNDAFYLTQEQRDALVDREPKSADIIVPLLRGRYVERYGTSWPGEWMINSHNGVKSQGTKPINIQKDFPLVYQHLQQWQDKLVKRGDKKAFPQ